jgi:hypothetical protein
MLNASWPDQPVAGRAADPGSARTDLDPDESHIFGPDAPNTRENDPRGSQVAPEAPPPKPPSTVLEHGDLAPDES